MAAERPLAVTMATQGDGTIVRFDAADGIGEILLADGTVVRFGGTACKEFRSPISVGQSVRAEGIAPGFGGRLRAARVTPLGETWDAEWLVYGLPASLTCDDGCGKRVHLRPLDLDRFAANHPTWTDLADLRRHAFGRATEPPTSPDSHPIFGPFRDQILATAIGAAVLGVAAGEPGVGESFVGGDLADVGEGAWPSHGGRPMLHLVQLGGQLASALGAPTQLNVFVSSVEGDDAVVAVVATSRPSRVARTPSIFPARRLEVSRWEPVFPSVLTLHRQSHGAARSFFDLWTSAPERTPLPALSIQFRYASTFASVDRLGEPLVAGGYGETHQPNAAPGDPPYRRLLTFETKHFPELARLCCAREGFTTLAVDYEPTTMRSWMY